MTTILREIAGGLNTFAPPHEIGANELTVASNVDLSNGSAVPLKALGDAVTTGLVGAQLAMYLLGSTWIGSALGRSWYVEYDNKVAALLEGGSGPTISNGTTTLGLGITPPATACTATINGGGNVTQAGCLYYVTYVNSLGFESGPSAASAAISPSSNNVDLTAIPVSSQTGVTKRKIYRLNASAIQLVTTINDNVTTTYSDTIAATALGDAITTTGYSDPPALSGLLGIYANRLWAFSGNKVYYSKSGDMTLWDDGYISLPEDVVGGTVASDCLLPVTGASGYMITGSGTSSFALNKPLQRYGTAAAFSFSVMPIGVLYWSPQGLVRYASGQFELVTAKRLSQANIDAVTASTVKAGRYREQYVLIHSGGGYVFDFRGGSMTITATDQTADAVHASRTTLYLSTGGAVKEWAAGSSNRTLTIQTGYLSAGNITGPCHVKRAKVEHSADVTATFYRDGVAFSSAQTKTASGQQTDMVMAPTGGWKRISLRLSSAGTIFTPITINPVEAAVSA